jgi:hypothetical protein
MRFKSVLQFKNSVYTLEKKITRFKKWFMSSKNMSTDAKKDFIFQNFTCV